jgi:hypothetical protein
MAGSFRNVRRREPDAPSITKDDRTGVSTFAGGLETTGNVQDLGGGKFGVTSSDPKFYGEKSRNFYEDPTINALAKLPSLEEAKQFTGLDPSFHGIQRSGDFQRVAQQQMAAERAGSQEALGRLIENRVEGAKRTSGDPTSVSDFALARAFGADYSAGEEQRDKQAALDTQLDAQRLRSVAPDAFTRNYAGVHDPALTSMYGDVGGFGRVMEQGRRGRR